MATSTQPQKKAIVVGAGAGGVAAAARLARAGFDVTVLEKNSFTGGRCSLIHHEGYRFDQGPSLLLLPQLFHETFQDLGTNLPEAGVDLLRCPGANYHIWFHDGALFRHSSDLAVMKEEIERWEGEEGFSSYLAWLREAHRHYEVSVSQVLHRNFTAFYHLARPSFLRHLINLHPLESIWSRACRYFRTERLRRVFTFAVMYMGISPFEAPATYSLLQYTEFAEGIWYPRGGFHAIVAALVKIGEKLGVQYRLSAPVSKVVTTPDGRKATGVLLASGETLDADVVVVNADLVYAYDRLLPKTPSLSRYSKSLDKRGASCSSISFYWSLRGQVPELSTHNIFLAEEYRESFEAIFKHRTLPDDPSFYVHVPSRVDPSAAPEGCDAVIVLVPVGHMSGDETEAQFKALVDHARSTVLATIRARTGCLPLEDKIHHEIVNDPKMWQAKFNLDKGSILGLTHDFFNVLSFRPRTRCEGVEGAYFVGASTHPGTGVPIVLAGAKLTTEQILEDRRMVVPWKSDKELEAMARPKTMLDQVRRISRFGSEELAICLVLLVGLLLAYVMGLSPRSLEPIAHPLRAS